MKSITFFFLSLMILGCGDIFTPTKKISGPYYLSGDDTNRSLYYDLDGAGIGRIDSINRIGWTDKYIFAENNSNYFFLDKTKDNQYFNANDIVKGPFDYATFHKMLDSLKISDFKFQVYLRK